MKKRILILLCLILFIVSVSAASATEDSNQTVIGEADDLVSNEDAVGVSLSDDDVVGSKDDGTFTAFKKRLIMLLRVLQ